MLPWLVIAFIALSDAMVCVNHFAFHKGSVMSFAIWQGIVAIVTIVVIFNWKRLSEIKPE